MIQVPLLDKYKFDPRSLALFRIALGILIIVDVLTFVPYIDIFFTDNGVLPPDSFRYRHWYDGSFLKLTGEQSTLVIILALQVLVATFLAIGWKTKLTASISFILLLSLNHRFPAAMNGGDSLLGLMIFWSLFLPLDQAFCLKRKAVTTIKSVSALASLSYSIQIALVYLMTVLIKNNEVWLYDASAVFHVLNLPDMVRPFWMGKFNELTLMLKALSVTTIIAEGLLGIGIILLPFLHNRLKLAVVVSGILMHISFFIFLDVGIFPMINMVSFLPFLPASFWLKLRYQALEIQEISLNKLGQAMYFAKNAALLICLYAVVSSNLAGYINKSKIPFWSATKHVSDLLDLNQKWGMFSTPATFKVWLNVIGVDENNKVVNFTIPNLYLSNESPLSGEKMYSSHRMQLYAENLTDSRYENHQEQFLIWMCKRKSKTEHASLSSLSLLSYVSPNFPSEHEIDAIEIDTLYTLHCFDYDFVSANK